jgi:NAD(P)-dependent dehydrogenase (short-subunit alcohol dehydrogenase family)
MSVAIDLAGHHALVTGAGKGIGREICRELARAGADVFAVSRTETELTSLGEEIDVSGVRYAWAAEDIRGVEVTERLAARATAAIGPIDILVNNAGVAHNALAEDVTEDEWDATLETNLKAAFFLAQAVGRGMLARGYGRIVNVTSAGDRVGWPGSNGQRRRPHGDSDAARRTGLGRPREGRTDAREDPSRPLWSADRRRCGRRLSRKRPGVTDQRRNHRGGWWLPGAVI